MTSAGTSEQRPDQAEMILSISDYPIFVWSALCSLQKQHDGFRDWLQTKEKQSMELDKVRVLFKDLQDDR